MWAPLIFGALSFGGSLLQGFGAKQAAAKQARLQAIADANAAQENARILNEVNAKREQVGREIREDLNNTGKIVEWAEKSGFNPVTFLNAGGLSHLANWADARKYQIPEYALTQASQVPQQHSALSAFGGALSAGVSAFATQYRADQSYELNSRKLDLAEQSMIFGLSSRPTMGGGTTRSVSYGNSGGGAGFVTAQRGAGGAGGLSDIPYPSAWKQGKVEVTNPHGKWNVDKTQADAETYETRYGDIAQEVFGAYNLLADGVKTMTGRTIGEWGDYWRNGPGRQATRAGKVEPYAPFAGAYPSWATP